jgi:hypothetical protein
MREIIESSKEKEALFLGRVKNFTKDEISSFLEKFDISLSDSLTENTAFCIESSILHPQEEELSYQVFKSHIPAFTLEEFEKFYADNINPKTLLMRLKLSNDMDRVIKLLKNGSFNDKFYLTLLDMYDWGDEGLFESDDNRDVTITFLKRFHKSEGLSDPGLHYSPNSIVILAQSLQNREALKALLKFPNFRIKVSKRGDKKVSSLREALAINPHIDSSIIDNLLKDGDPNINYFLSMNENLEPNHQMSLLKNGEREVLLQLSKNSSLIDECFFELLNSDDQEILQNLLLYQKIDKKRLNSLTKLKDFHLIGYNRFIKEEVLKELLSLNDKKLHKALATNELLDSGSLEILHDIYGYEIAKELASNINLPQRLIFDFFELNNEEIDIVLAKNSSTPQEILIEYYNRDKFELNASLCENPSTPIYILEQFQLDRSLMHILKDNKTFTNKIKNSLGY